MGRRTNADPLPAPRNAHDAVDWHAVEALLKTGCALALALEIAR
jgi:hypothetical protein